MLRKFLQLPKEDRTEYVIICGHVAALIAGFCVFGFHRAVFALVAAVYMMILTFRMWRSQAEPDGSADASTIAAAQFASAKLTPAKGQPRSLGLWFDCGQCSYD